MEPLQIRILVVRIIDEEAVESMMADMEGENSVIEDAPPDGCPKCDKSAAQRMVVGE